MESLGKNQRKLLVVLLALCLYLLGVAARHHDRVRQKQPLRFGRDGEFKILQVADMHYANGKTTRCLDVTHSERHRCSDLNTVAFIRHLILAEEPDLIVFTGDNIMGIDAKNPIEAMNAAFEPAISSGIPWAAILGNHDHDERKISRENVMKHIVGMKNTLSQLNPADAPDIEGFGNYNLKVYGARHTRFENTSVLNLYFLDTGGFSKIIPDSYDWIRTSQRSWFERTSKRLQTEYKDDVKGLINTSAPGIVFMHIPTEEISYIQKLNMTGVRQEKPKVAKVNSGFFTSMIYLMDVKAVFSGHDHLNDYCGRYGGINLCYAGAAGYHAYGKVGWHRRARVVTARLQKASLRAKHGRWGDVKKMSSWKRLDDDHMNAIGVERIWYKGAPGAYSLGCDSCQ